MTALLRRLDAWPFWQARQPRERVLLGVLAGVAVLVLLLIAVVRPLQAARGAAEADIRTYQALAARLRATTAPGQPARPQRAGDATTVAAAVAGEVGLAVAASSPSGAGARVAFAEGGYDGVLRWAASLEATSRYRVRGLVVVPGATPGLVRAEATIG